MNDQTKKSTAQTVKELESKGFKFVTVPEAAKKAEVKNEWTPTGVAFTQNGQTACTSKTQADGKMQAHYRKVQLSGKGISDKLFTVKQCEAILSIVDSPEKIAVLRQLVGMSDDEWSAIEANPGKLFIIAE